MALDSEAQVDAIRRFVGEQGTVGDSISRGEGPFFHYTDYNALASIVMKNDLWLTDARFSNDAQELEHGRVLVSEEVAALGEDTASKNLHSLAKDVSAEIETQSKRVETASEPVYVCCFCEKPDLLSQWRGYAANGGGVAIEVDPQAFGYLAGTDCPIGVMRFWKVFYDEEQKRRRVKEVLEFWAGQPCAHADRVESALATLQFFVPTFKNPWFKEEAEWRLIFTPGSRCRVSPRFRTARGLLVPFYELAELVKSFAAPLPLGIKSICVGPGPYKDVNANSVRMLLDSYGFQGAKVIRSDIPYRG